MDDDPIRSTLRSVIATTAWLVLAAGLGAACALGVAFRLAPGTFNRFEALDGERRERAHDASEARLRMLSRYAWNEGGADIMDRARRDLRRRLAAEIPPGPLPALTAGAECAARLRGLARVMRSLAGAAPAAPGAGRSGILLVHATSREAVQSALVSRDVAALDAALAAELEGWRTDILDDAKDLEAPSRAGVWSHWRDLMETRATEFEFLAAPLEADEPGGERAAIMPAAALRALAFETRVPDPSLALATYAAEPQRIVVRPIARFWEPPAIFGALVAMAVVMGWRRPRRRGRTPPDLTALPSRPDPTHVWLHVVTGGRRDTIARAVCELAAHALARRQRVVVVDASRALRLHETLKLSPRLGFVDCVGAGLPALGLLQNSGFTGLFLLSRGRGGPVSNWLALDRVLEELRPHFPRVILAFDPGIPEMVGGVLAGRVMSGWWAGPGSAQDRAARCAGNRLAIALDDLSLSGTANPSLEWLEARLASLEGSAPEAPAPISVTTATAPRFRISAPAVLDCDSRIRQKLRFLAWMRRVRAERAGSEPAGRT